MVITQSDKARPATAGRGQVLRLYAMVTRGAFHGRDGTNIPQQRGESAPSGSITKPTQNKQNNKQKTQSDAVRPATAGGGQVLRLYAMVTLGVFHS